MKFSSRNGLHDSSKPRSELRPRSRRIATGPDARLTGVAETVGIAERAAAQIVSDLDQAGYSTKTVSAGATASSRRRQEPRHRYSQQ
jgi:hypothetical protein